MNEKTRTVWLKIERRGAELMSLFNFHMFLFNTEKAENTEMHRENMTIGMRVDKRDLKVSFPSIARLPVAFHRGWRMTGITPCAALCAEPSGSSCPLPVWKKFSLCSSALS
jgi:hypothetical protein